MVEITQNELDEELRRLGESVDVLTDIEARRWTMRIQGMSLGEIARKEGRDKESIRRSIFRAEGKLKNNR